MKLVFAGTPEFAVSALDALHAAGHNIVAVFTQPDRPAGRGRKLSPSPVAIRAEALKLPVFKPAKLDADAQQQLRDLAPEVMVVVAYGLLLPQAVLDIPPRGCLNIHASLLPRWRGAAPIQRAIEAGDRETGITIMRMDAGLDTGPMLLRESIPIGDRETAAELHDRLARQGAKLIVAALDRLATEQLPAQAQPPDGATYARKLDKAEARIDWTEPAERIARRVRAFNPAPVCWCEVDGERLRIWQAHSLSSDPGDAAPGTVLPGADHLDVACGDGVLRIEQLQWPGGRVMSSREALHARPLAGAQLG